MMSADNTPNEAPPHNDDDSPQLHLAGPRDTGDCRRSDGVRIDPGEWRVAMEQLSEAIRFAGLMDRDALKRTPLAIETVLRLHPYWAGTIRHNSMLRRDECGGHDTARVVITKIQTWFETNYRCVAEKGHVADVVHALASASEYHPVEQYLSSLEQWDGQSRIGDLVDILAVEEEHHALAQAMCRAWMIGAVKRVYEPGCQMDYMLVLKGEQGMRKTSFWRALAGGYPFYNGLSARHWTDPYRIHSAWIHECAELEGFTTRGELAEVKAHITEIGDTLALKYEVQASVWLRRCVFAGSTNRDDFLRDETGARRFWIIDSTLDTPLNADAVAAMRNQLWAEIIVAYRSGELCYLTDKTLIAQHKAQAHKYAPKDDPWEQKIQDSLDRHRGMGLDPLKRPPIHVATLLGEIGVDLPKQTKTDVMRVATVLRELGFEKKQIRDGRRIFKAWIWPDQK